LDVDLGRESLGVEIKLPYLERQDRELLIRMKAKEFKREVIEEEVKASAKAIQGKSISDIIILMQIA